jgi:RTX calcium-binding nonapeptide repeat (4 copies)
MLTAAVVALVGSTLVSGTAMAATLRADVQHFVGAEGHPPYDVTTVVYRAAPGETNRVMLEWRADALTVSDTGAELTVGDNCSAIDAHTASCPITAATTDATAQVVLGDGDDSATGAASIYGGTGADELTGGGGDDYLSGGPGEDILNGEAGNDRLVDHERDHDATSLPASDRFDGGDGVDSVSYGARDSGVVVDLARQSEHGSSGEQDALSRIEAVIGTNGPDLLIGDERANALTAGPVGSRAGDRLRGAAGNDRLEGSIGVDVIDGGAGDDWLDPGHQARRGDVLRGGPGDDRLTPFNAGRARGERGNDTVLSGYPEPGRLSVSCGPGRDRIYPPLVVERPSGPGVLPSDCEAVVAGLFGLDYVELETALRRTRGEIHVRQRMSCRPDEFGNPPQWRPGRLHLYRSDARRRVLIGTVPSFPRCHRALRRTVRLTSAGRELVRRVAFGELGVEVRLSGTGWGPSGYWIRL